MGVSLNDLTVDGMLNTTNHIHVLYYIIVYFMDGLRDLLLKKVINPTTVPLKLPFLFSAAEILLKLYIFVISRKNKIIIYNTTILTKLYINISQEKESSNDSE